jgi:lysine 6-dehydrogenase
MLVLGAGLQGSACAYDLLQNREVEEVRLADINIQHLPPFLAPYSGPRLIPTPLDVRDREAVLAVMRSADAVMSAIPVLLQPRPRKVRRRSWRALRRPRRQH